MINNLVNNFIKCRIVKQKKDKSTNLMPARRHPSFPTEKNVQWYHRTRYVNEIPIVEFSDMVLIADLCD